MQFLRSLVLLAFALPASAQDVPKRPNLLIIMVDDMGYSDIGCFGGEVKNPNLDSLAAGGMRFTQFYNTAKCHTTRAELMTGNYAYAVNPLFPFPDRLSGVFSAAGEKANPWH